MEKRKSDIERYLSGEMTPAEMHALEKEALSDPFLSEALEGVNRAGAEPFLFDLHELHRSIHQRVRPRRHKIISMWNWSLGIAAGLVLIALSAVIIIGNLPNRQQSSLATAEEPEKDSPPVVADSTEEPDQPRAVHDSPQTQPAPARRQRQIASSSPAESQPVADGPAEVTEDVGRTSDLLALDSTSIDRSIAGTSTKSANEAVALTQPALASGETISADSILFTGRVTSAEDRSPLPGVSVTVNGTPVQTETDKNGYFKVNVIDPTPTLTFNFVGMEEVELAPADKVGIDVEMKPDLSQLSEIVVIGYDAPTVSPVRQVAEPQGGKQAFQEYLEKELRYPEQALENNVEGRVTLEFTVGIDGALGNFNILKGIGYGCDDEAIRLIKEGPKWTPSRRDSKPIAEKVKVRLKFAKPPK